MSYKGSSSLDKEESCDSDSSIAHDHFHYARPNTLDTYCPIDDIRVNWSCKSSATIQVLKKAGRPSERLVSHENCKFKNHHQHECVHVQEITEAAGTEEAEADSEYDNAMREAIQGVQDAVTTINEHLEEVRYEIVALEQFDIIIFNQLLD